MRTRALLFAAAAVIATLTGALVGALTLPRSEAGSVRVPPPSSDPRPSPSQAPGLDISCDEPEHELECLLPSDDDEDDDDSSGPGGGENSGPG